jgi:hypothetical protein
VPRPRRLRCAVDSRCGDSHRGFAVFEVEWDDAEAIAASLSSPEGQAFERTRVPTSLKGPFSELSRARCPQLLTSPAVCPVADRLTVLMIEQRRVEQSHLRSIQRDSSVHGPDSRPAQLPL